MERLENEPAINDSEQISDENEQQTQDAEASCESANTTDEAANGKEEDKLEIEEYTNYAELAKADMEELRSLFPHLRDKTNICELDNPLRYAALRDLGLTAKEAYLATSEPIQRYDNRSHLKSSVPKSAAVPLDMLGRSELEAARELFSGLSDREIQKLYKKVSR